MASRPTRHGPNVPGDDAIASSNTAAYNRATQHKLSGQTPYHSVGPATPNPTKADACYEATRIVCSWTMTFYTRTEPVPDVRVLASSGAATLFVDFGR